MAFGATLEVLTSREFKVSGAIGPVTSLGKKSPNVSDLEVGKGGTNAWSLGGVDPGTTVAIYFDITNPGVSFTFQTILFSFVRILVSHCLPIFTLHYNRHHHCLRENAALSSF